MIQLTDCYDRVTGWSRMRIAPEETRSTVRLTVAASARDITTLISGRPGHW